MSETSFDLLPYKEALSETERASDIHVTWLGLIYDNSELAKGRGDVKWHDHWRDVHSSLVFYAKAKDKELARLQKEVVDMRQRLFKAVDEISMLKLKEAKC